MKKIFVMCGMCILGVSMAASADDSMQPDHMQMDQDCMAMHFKMMDKNGDGMISKDEYMDAMKMKWEKMPKSKGNMVSMDDMQKAMMMDHKDCSEKMMNK